MRRWTFWSEQTLLYGHLLPEAASHWQKCGTAALGGSTIYLFLRCRCVPGTIVAFCITRCHFRLLPCRRLQLRYKTLDMVVARKGTTEGWDMRAVLARHRWLLERLAGRWDKSL